MAINCPNTLYNSSNWGKPSLQTTVLVVLQYSEKLPLDTLVVFLLNKLNLSFGPWHVCCSTVYFIEKKNGRRVEGVPRTVMGKKYRSSGCFVGYAETLVRLLDPFQATLKFCSLEKLETSSVGVEDADFTTERRNSWCSILFENWTRSHSRTNLQQPQLPWSSNNRSGIPDRALCGFLRETILNFSAHIRKYTRRMTKTF